VRTDSDGIEYFAATPGECCRQFAEALHTMAQHVRRRTHLLRRLLAARLSAGYTVGGDYSLLLTVRWERRCRKNGTMSRKCCASTCS
jgi:hypothetical protein